MQALKSASIADLPELASTLKLFGSGRPVAMTAKASSYRRQASRGAMAATYALNAVDREERRRAEELQDWNPRHWAMEAMAYLAVSDDVIAVLGATRCSAVCRDSDDGSEQAYLREVVNRLAQ